MIASRDHLCINPDLKEASNSEKIYMCKRLVGNAEEMKEPSCEFYEKMALGLTQPGQNITDIEDLCSMGRDSNCCPYFMSKTIAKNSDIIFLPYNYLIDPKLREMNEIELRGSIVIIDEAHNINQVCEDSSSASIKFTEIRAALKDLNYVYFHCILKSENVV